MKPDRGAAILLKSLFFLFVVAYSLGIGMFIRRAGPYGLSDNIIDIQALVFADVLGPAGLTAANAAATILFFMRNYAGRRYGYEKIFIIVCFYLAAIGNAILINAFLNSYVQSFTF